MDTNEQRILNTKRIIRDFVDAADKWHHYLRTLKEWNAQTKAKYYKLKDDYMKKRELHTKDLGLDKVMPEWMWPR